MAGVTLDKHQIEATNRMQNGCILCGGVGSGKSRTSLAYFYLLNGGSLDTEKHKKMRKHPLDLYIVTTARKRDTLEWEKELLPFLMSTNPEATWYSHKIVIDSWNNIKKYSKVENSFFIFDEQRVVGSGTWVKAFLKIAKKNQWVLLSATPGDTWEDYIPVFIANGFYKNRTQFLKEHAVYSRFTKFPKIDKFIGTGKLVRYRKQLLIPIITNKHTVSEHKLIETKYDISTYKTAFKKRWDPYKDEPVVNAGALCYLLRKIVNSDKSREEAILKIVAKHNNKVIIFYNFDYELEILKHINYGKNVVVAEWNGHAHDPVPNTKEWVYLVQYTAGAEGWNCITTDTIIFYSQNYSYKVMIQAAGRIDRRNTPYKFLYYYHIKTKAPIDLAIARALNNKKKFNAHNYVKW